MKLVFTLSFERDTKNILDYYKVNNLQELIIKFNAEINTCIDFIVAFSEASPVVPRNKKYRKKLFRNLPYKIYYRFQEKKIFFMRIRHVRRKTVSLRN